MNRSLRRQLGIAPARHPIMVRVTAPIKAVDHSGLTRNDWDWRVGLRSVNLAFMIGNEETKACIADIEHAGPAAIIRWAEHISYTTAFTFERARSFLDSLYVELFARRNGCLPVNYGRMSPL